MGLDEFSNYVAMMFIHRSQDLCQLHTSNHCPTPHTRPEEGAACVFCFQ